ncbi:MAG: hypothetical protein JJE09_12195 [Bacteroidia bacterium]|nr:hypothetical protein [Bacteroidia bacterium]
MNYKNAFLITLIIEVAVALLAVINYGVTLEALQAVTRFSGRVSLVLFSLIFLFQKQLQIKSILSEKYFLIFAIAHGIHLIELLSYVYLSGVALVPYRVVGGFLAYAFIFVMPWLEQLHHQSKFSSKHFSIITVFYLYYVWLIFFMTYLSRVQGTFPNAGGNYVEHISLLGWVAVMLGIKLSALISNKNSTPKFN